MIRCLRTVLLGTLFLSLAGAATGETWRFAAIGDTPYSDYERRELPHLLADIADQNPAFIVHVGDFKDSRAPCNDEMFLDRRALFDASRTPFIYVVGDNEWTDCQQVAAGRYDPVERLQRLRELFFAQPVSLGKQTLKVEQQAGGYSEHLRWRLGPVLFASLNVPGPNNNFGSGPAPSNEFLARNPPLIDWLRQAFAIARREQAAGIVIVMQANPGFKHHAAGLTHAGFRDLLAALQEETLAFPGQVLLIHGDTHWQRIDHPLRDPQTHLPIGNFTRLETFGYPLLGWVKVIIDSDDPRLFRFEVYPHRRR